jgi:hypothetical protein
MACSSASLARQTVHALSLTGATTNTHATRASVLQAPGRIGAQLPPVRLASASSAFQGSKHGFEKGVTASKKKAAGVCMAWGGSLASVRLIIQGKHMDVSAACKRYFTYWLYAMCQLPFLQSGHAYFGSIRCTCKPLIASLKSPFFSTSEGFRCLLTLVCAHGIWKWELSRCLLLTVQPSNCWHAFWCTIEQNQGAY